MSSKLSNKECYEKVISDSEEIIKYIDELESNDYDIDNVKVPEVVGVFYNPEDKKLSKKKTETIALANAMGGIGSSIMLANVAPNLCAVPGGVVAGGMLARGIGGALAARGLGLAIMPFSPIAGAAIAAIGVLWGTKQKKKAKPLADELDKKRTSVESVIGSMLAEHDLLSVEKDVVFNDIKERCSKRIKEGSKKVDDFFFKSRNKRIMEYQKISLNQYENIRILTEDLSIIKDKYNAMLDDFNSTKEKYDETLADLHSMIERCEKIEKEKKILAEKLEKCTKLLSLIDGHKEYLSR